MERRGERAIFPFLRTHARAYPPFYANHGQFPQEFSLCRSGLLLSTFTPLCRLFINFFFSKTPPIFISAHAPPDYPGSTPANAEFALGYGAALPC